jgi:hypothetical protein
MRGMIPYAELEKALRRWRVRQAGGTLEPVEAEAHVVEETALVAEEAHPSEVVTEVSADAVVATEVFLETSEETRAVDSSGLMPVVQFDRE